jgi:E3 ubiquitin-protein ligase RBBP6
MGAPPKKYICHKCHQPGHWIHDCPGIRDAAGRLVDPKAAKRPTGIPNDFLIETSNPIRGAYLTNRGTYVLPKLDA